MTASAHLPCGPHMLSRKFRTFGLEAQGTHPPRTPGPASLQLPHHGDPPLPRRSQFRHLPCTSCTPAVSQVPCDTLVTPACVGGAGETPPRWRRRGPAALFTEPSRGQASCPSQRAGMGGQLEAPGTRSRPSLADALTIRQGCACAPLPNAHSRWVGPAWPGSPPRWASLPHTRHPVFGGGVNSPSRLR